MATTATDAQQRAVRRALRGRVEVAGDCWLWRGFLSSDGYGQLSYRENGRQITKKAHRAVYEVLVGPVPDGLELDHVKYVGTPNTASDGRNLVRD